MATLHVIYDPYCGWCYGAAPLVEAARGIEGLDIQLHGGGMMAGNNRQQMTAGLRDFILQNDPRVAALTGQPFGDAYRAMLNDTSVWLDSTPPTMAIVAAEQWRRGLDMLDCVQRAHFIEGQRIADPRVLAVLAEQLGLPRGEFLIAFAQAMEAPGGHIRESREWLARVGAQGFPTFALEKQEIDGNLTLARLDNSRYFGMPGEWRSLLQSALLSQP
jgi:putative protein-disulfide isomerase